MTNDGTTGLSRMIQEILDEGNDKEYWVQIDEKMDSVYEYDSKGNLIRHSIEARPETVKSNIPSRDGTERK